MVSMLLSPFPEHPMSSINLLCLPGSSPCDFWVRSLTSQREGASLCPLFSVSSSEETLVASYHICVESSAGICTIEALVSVSTFAPVLLSATWNPATRIHFFFFFFFFSSNSIKEFIGSLHLDIKCLHSV